MPRRSLLYLAACLLLLGAPAFPASEPEPVARGVYEVPAKGERQLQAILEQGIDVLALTRRGTLQLSATAAQVDFLQRLTGQVVVLREPGAKATIAALDANLGAYRTYAEATTVMQNLVAVHPTLASLTSIGQSHELRSLYALKISDAVGTDEDEPEVLLMGCHHARELMSVEMPLKFAEYLLANYGTNPQVTQLVNEREIWIVPIVNPDGYVYVQNNHGNPDSGTWWRKNRRNNGDGTFGVDINRNYGYLWGYDNVGSSATTSSAIYRGPSPFSEPETRAVRDFCASRHFKVWLSYHSYSDLLLYPWGYALDYTMDHEIYLRLGEELGAGTGYVVGNPAMGAIYRTNGGSDDWAYGETALKPVIYGFTPEVGSFEEGGFAPAESFIDPYFNLLLPMNLRLLERAANPEKVLGPAPVAITTVHGTAAGELVLTWTGNAPSDPNPATGYELEGYQMQGFQTLGAESASPWVDLAGGFATSTARAFAGSASYFSGNTNNLSSTLTLAGPFLVTPSQPAFTCRLWYDVELDYDYAYVEVSEDQGIVWRPIAGNLTTTLDPNGANLGNGITGTSGGSWVLASFPLNAYFGQEIMLRLRYDTDGGVLGQGVYADVLNPIPAFGIHSTLATGIPSPSHAFVPAALGSWLYRVRGTDADGDIARWSLSFAVQVTNPSDVVSTPAFVTRLQQNVPNPFNPFTTLLYTVGGTGQGQRRVELAVFDAAGRRVATLVQSSLPPGQHRATWDGTGTSGTRLRSGVYFARLLVDDETVQTRKLLLLE